MSGAVAFDRERLAAFVDGELSPEEAAEVVLHLADHPDDQAWVDELMAANAVLARAFGGPVTEPVPPAILAAIGVQAPQEAAQVIPFRPSRARGMAGGFAGGLAIAATVAGVALLVGLMREPAATLALGPVAPDSGLAAFLNEAPSGFAQELDGVGEVMILASMPTTDGFCRELEVMDEGAGLLKAGIACSTGGGDWDVAVLIEERLPEGEAEDAFTAASGVLSAGLSPFLDQVGAGMVMTPEDEAAAIAAGWLR